MFITKLLNLQNQIRIFHWQTKSYAEHKAFGKLYEGLDPIIDSFVEVYFGKNGTRKATKTFDISLKNYETGMGIKVIDDALDFLVTEIPQIVKPEDTELLNIRDEMLALLNQTKYLLTLK